MNKKIQKKTYAKIQFKLASPLMIGSGENHYTDRDILKDNQGRPFIPGSAIAGVCRSFFSKEDAKHYFGHIAGFQDKESENENSRLVFYNAVLQGEKYHISQRDGVGLDEYKTAIKGCKFDMEVVEPGITFVTYIEQNFFQDDKFLLDEILEKWQQEEVYLGAKTMRGYGAITEVEVGLETFDFSKAEDVQKWLDFDMYRDLKITKEKKSSFHQHTFSLELTLQQTSGCMVRKYTTAVLPEKNGRISQQSMLEQDPHVMPDFEQLTLHDDTPVIPGTSWAGAFYHRMRRFMESQKDSTLSLKEYFGYVTGKKAAKSLIRFSETPLTGGQSKIVTRTAINRFTGGVVNESLYTEKYYSGGKTVLKISLDKKAGEFQDFQKILSAAIADLHYGYLAVGGATSVGRGLFTVTKINGVPVKENIYMQLLELMEKWG